MRQKKSAATKKNAQSKAVEKHFGDGQNVDSSARHQQTKNVATDTAAGVIGCYRQEETTTNSRTMSLPGQATSDENSRFCAKSATTPVKRKVCSVFVSTTPPTMRSFPRKACTTPDVA